MLRSRNDNTQQPPPSVGSSSSAVEFAPRHALPAAVPSMMMETPEMVMSLLDGKGRRASASSRGHICGVTTTSVAPGNSGDDDRAELERQQCNQASPKRAPLADTCVGKGWPTSSHVNKSSRCGEAAQKWRIQPRHKRRSLSFAAGRHEEVAAATQEKSVAGSSTSTSTTCSNVLVLLESAFCNLAGVIADFQQGVRACDYTDGDLAAQNGHMHIVTNVASVFSDQAMVLAAAQGHLGMVKFLDGNRKEGATVEAMNLASTCGHLDVVEWLHANRTEGCTTRAMDGAARNAHIHVSSK